MSYVFRAIIVDKRPDRAYIVFMKASEAPRMVRGADLAPEGDETMCDHLNTTSSTDLDLTTETCQDCGATRKSWPARPRMGSRKAVKAGVGQWKTPEQAARIVEEAVASMAAPKPVVTPDDYVWTGFCQATGCHQPVARGEKYCRQCEHDLGPGFIHLGR